MAKRDPRTGELLTTNYSWTKPTVGSSVDAWGGFVNADLDAIDSVVHGIQTSIPSPSFTQPLMNGTAAAGTAPTWARADHVHPTDARIIGDSRIINGDMLRDQRNNGASGTAAGYTVDRWQFSSNLTGKGTWQRVVAGPSLVALGFGYSLGFTSSSAYAVAAGDYSRFLQIIEADMVSDFAWGTANAQPVTLSFTVNSSLTGSFGGSITNVAGTRSYPFAYSIPAANVWTKIAITVPGDTAGTWVLSGNAGSVNVNFGLGAGATVSGPAGAWTGGSLVSATGSVSIVATNGAIFYVTGVKLEIGSVATPFNRQSVAKSLADCQRYYEVCDAVWTGDGTISNTYTVVVPFAVEKRASPTITSILQTGTSNGNFNARAVQATVAGPATRAVTWGGTMVSTGPARGFNDSFSASAEL